MRIADLIALTRPKFQVPSIFSYLVGFLFVLSTFHSFPLYKFLAGLILASFLVTGGSLVLNQFFDYPLDQQTQEGPPLIRSDLGRRTSLYYASILFLFAIPCSLLINRHAFYLTLGGILIAILYSAPPLRLKKRRYLDSVVNGVAYGVLPVLLGGSVVSLLTVRVFLACVPFIFGYTAGHMLLAIPHIRSDAHVHIKTSAVILGRQKTIKVAAILFGIMFVIFLTEVIWGLYPREAIVCLFPAPLIFLRLASALNEEGKEAFKVLQILFLSVILLLLGSLCLSV